MASAGLVVELRLGHPPALLASVERLESLARRHDRDLGAAGDVHVAEAVLAQRSRCEPKQKKLPLHNPF